MSQYSPKSEFKEYACYLYIRLFGKENEELFSDNNISIEEVGDIEETDLVSELSSSIKSVHCPPKRREIDRDDILDDLKYLDESQKRTNKLECLFNALLTISPTSTLSERAFSKSSFIKTKEKKSFNSQKFEHCFIFKRLFYKIAIKICPT